MPRACSQFPCATPACLDRRRVFSGTGGETKPIGGVQTADDSVPRKRFLKDLISVGEYVSNGQKFAITTKDMDRWIENGKRFIAAGNQIPVPDGHTDDASANRGYVLELFREGGTLYGVVEMIGADSIATAARSKVSINTEPDYVDGKGNKYDDLITHVALTNAPVIPDQNGFLPIAASRNAKTNTKQPARLFTLAKGTETSSMEYLTKIAALLGISGTESMDDAALTEAIAKSIKAIQSSGEDLSKQVTASLAEVNTLKLSLSKATAKPDEPTPMLLRIASENRSLKLSQLVTAGKITPAVKDKLADIYIGKDNAGLKLSLDAVGDGQFAALCDALTQNDAVKLGEQTTVQNGLTLSRNDGKPATGADAATVSRLAGHIGIKQGS